MAEEGLILTNDGIFAGIATFEYRGSQKAKYRLEAVQKRTGMWEEIEDAPNPEQIENDKTHSWEYVARLRDFYIYRSFNLFIEALTLKQENGIQTMKYGHWL